MQCRPQLEDIEDSDQRFRQKSIQLRGVIAVR
jgi:hypothetical protein